MPLTEEGERQARAVGAALRGREFALVLSSPLLRALDTAKLAGFEPEVRDDLAEWDYGEYDGLTTPRDPRAGSRLDDLALRRSWRGEPSSSSRFALTA